MNIEFISFELKGSMLVKLEERKRVANINEYQ